MDTSIDKLYSSLTAHLRKPQWKLHADYKLFYRENFPNHYVEQIVFLKGDRIRHIFNLDASKYPFEGLKDAAQEAIYKTFVNTFQKWPQDIDVDLFWDEESPKHLNIPWQKTTTFGWDLIIDEKQILVPFGPQVLLYVRLAQRNIQLIIELINSTLETKKKRAAQQANVDDYRAVVREYIREKTFGWVEIEGGNLYLGYSFRVHDAHHNIIEEINLNGLLGSFTYSFYLTKERYYGTSLDHKLDENSAYQEIKKSAHSGMEFSSSQVPYNPWGNGEGSIKLSCSVKFDQIDCSVGFINNLVIVLRKQLMLIKEQA
ncbi:hypothetical protein [Paenibacillus sp. 32352]|uniref:hypothetical protein n=1 Tax=Paenibacillus sp. 32352 TaxID=1969111 RepID=UPI0009AD8AF0|nr:hypothetical protein [Paenibacillus sp. 32352]